MLSTVYRCLAWQNTDHSCQISILGNKLDVESLRITKINKDQGKQIMTTPDSAQGQTPDPMDDGIDDTPRAAERSRLEESIMKGSMWRHKTLRKAEEERVKACERVWGA